MKKPGEKIDTYINELRTRANTCEFGDLREPLIKDRIVSGITDCTLRARFLHESYLDLQKAISICRAAESTNDTIKELGAV